MNSPVLAHEKEVGDPLPLFFIFLYLSGCFVTQA